MKKKIVGLLVGLLVGGIIALIIFLPGIVSSVIRFLISMSVGSFWITASAGKK